MILLAELLIKSSIVLLIGLALMSLFRRQSAALRHWVLSASLACAVATPLGQFVVPAWSVRHGAMFTSRQMAPTFTATSSGVARGSQQTAGGNSSPLIGSNVVASERAFPWTIALPAIWAVGALLACAVLAVGLVRLARIASHARPVVDGPWAERAEQLRRDFGVTGPIVLLESSHPTLLVTWGIRRPKVLLPAAAREWPMERLDLVLGHELAHVGRGDWLVQFAAELVRALCWINPLVWVVCNRLRLESERACDDAVLNRGVDGTVYAAHLVRIARDLQQHRVWTPALAIARMSCLERRVRAMLDTRVNRHPISRLTSAGMLIALLAITIPVAGFAAAQAQFSTVAGSINDPMNGLLPGVTLELTNVQTAAKHEVQTDANGRYEFVGLPPGDYLLEARLPGFALMRGNLTLAGQNVQQDFTLQIGTLEETVTVRMAPGAVAETSRPPADVHQPRPVPPCNSTVTAGRPAVGGNLRPPMKLAHVAPEYPAALRDAGVEGAVVLNGRLGTDGSIQRLDVVSSPNADLTAAAIAAVRQWQFDATLLNCVPVEVALKVTVNFQLER